HQIYNWYGVPADLYASAALAEIDEKQSYYTAFIGGDIGFSDSYFSGGEGYYRRFWDAAESGENRAVLSPKFEFPMGSEWVHLDVKVRSEEHTSELQSRENLVCRLLLEKKKR